MKHSFLAGVKIREDVFHLAGNYLHCAELFEFNALRQSSTGSGASAKVPRVKTIFTSQPMFNRSFAFLLCATLFLNACSTKHYRESADKEVAKIIRQKTPAVPNMDTNFTIETSEKFSLEGLPISTNVEESFGPEGKSEEGAHIISLEKALEIAVKQSPSYQARKENLYLEALSLTLSRHRFTPIFSAGSKNVLDTQQVQNGVDSLVEVQTSEIDANARVDQLLETGGRLALAFSTDFLRFVSGDQRAVYSSALAGSFIQPLWRGAGYKVNLENLTQAERNLLYALREFARFRKQFSVDIAANYYEVLQNRDGVRNSWRGLQDFKANVERERAFTEEGLRPQADLDQLKQAQLETESRWISAVRTYQENLDKFKIQLRLPVNAAVILDDHELERLKIVHPTITVEEATRVALVSRLDLYNERDQAEDAIRHVEVAKNGLKTQLDFVTQASVPSQTGNGFPSPDFDRYRWSAGLNIDLPLDRKAERNTYRAALIADKVAARTLELAIENVKLDVNTGWRSLDQAKRVFEISELGVELSKRRVEEQELRAELGRGTARDLVDAQTDLINAKNTRTVALVAHTVSRLRFWQTMGILTIKDDGQWEELSNAENK